MKTLMPIGGSVDAEHPRVIQEFITRAGGAEARIVILPQASALAETGPNYVRQCLELGAKTAVSLEFRHRSEADSAENLKAIERASGIFFSGGVQMRITQLLGGTRLEQALLQAYQRGCVIAGSSAGASVLSKTMIAYGESGPTPRQGIVQLTAGLGFTDRFVFDQHFRQHDRLGRLIYAVSANPGILGIGLDEDTAAIIENEETIYVLGSGAITIVDGHKMQASNIAEAERKSPIAASGLLVHVLTEGCFYTVSNGKTFIPFQVSLAE